jgi:hypothetical protein
MATAKKGRTRSGRPRPRVADRDLSTEEGDEQPVRRSPTSARPGSERPGGILATRSRWERNHLIRMRNKENVYLVRATATGYYNHRLWREGEEFKMAIDPKIDPPRWVVAIKKPRGRVIGVPAKGGGVEPIDALPNELEDQDMPLDGRGSAVKARQRQLEEEEEEEERHSRRQRRRARDEEEDEDDE